jgi:hypothetical protein
VFNFDIHGFIGFPVGTLVFYFFIMPEDQTKSLIFVNILLNGVTRLFSFLSYSYLLTVSFS